MSDSRKSKTIIGSFLCLIAFACYLLAQSSGGNRNGSGGTGTVTHTAGNLTLNCVVVGNGTADLKCSANTVDDGTTFSTSNASGILASAGPVSSGANGGAAGVAKLFGSTSGSATLTAPAVAGTTTNPVVSTNQISAPAFVQSAAASGGFLNAGQNANIQWQAGGTSVSVSPNGLANAFAVSTTATSVGTASLAFTANKGQHITPQAAANDLAGTCTAAAATTCTVTFTTAYTSAPACTVTDQTNITTAKALPSTATLVITTASASSDVFSYICIGNPN